MCAKETTKENLQRGVDDFKVRGKKFTGGNFLYIAQPAKILSAS